MGHYTASIATLRLLMCNPQYLLCKQVQAYQCNTFISRLQYIKLFNDSIRCVPSAISVANTATTEWWGELDQELTWK